VFASQRPRGGAVPSGEIASGAGHGGDDDSGDDGYEAMAARMLELAHAQPGFVAVESARGADGFGITVSYWTDRAAIAAWQRNSEHLVAQHLGRARWYESFHLVVTELLDERRHERRDEHR
jgi:heme-degrading monooxygenase HmoA